MSKRRRTDGVSRRVSRPIDKSLVVVNQSLSTTQQSTLLFSVTFPCTVVGLRWVLDGTTSTAGNNTFFWAIVLVRDGNTANTMLVADTNTLYEPEQNALAWGHGAPRDVDAGGGPAAVHVEGQTKTMRKLMIGDRIFMIQIAEAAVGNFEGAVQFFCKT